MLKILIIDIDYKYWSLLVVSADWSWILIVSADDECWWWVLIVRASHENSSWVLIMSADTGHGAGQSSALVVGAAGREWWSVVVGASRECWSWILIMDTIHGCQS